MTTFSRESDLTRLVDSYFRRRTYRAIASELQFYEYRVDLYAHSRRLDSSVAIELKLSNWSKAIRQALVYQLCADYVYLAMPASIRRVIPIDQLECHGLGLVLVYPSRCREVVSPRLSPVVRSDYRSFYREQLLCHGGGR